MKFKNQKSGFVGILVLILIVAAVSGGGVYMYQKNKVKMNTDGNYNYPATSTTNVESDVNSSAKLTPPSKVKGSTFTINGNALSVMNDGKMIQTLVLNTDEVGTQSFENSVAFKTNQDVNFDGYNDIGVLSGIGYGGVNTMYDYYLYNTNTGKFDKSADLISISVVGLDPVKKQFNNTFKDGPGYTTVTYTWTGTGYAKSEQKDEIEKPTTSVYKNTEFGFSSILSPKIGTPTIRTVAGFKSIIFPLKESVNNNNGVYVTNFEVYRILNSSTSCVGEATLPDLNNKYGHQVESSWFGDAGMREYFHHITIGNKQFCVKNISSAGTETPQKLIDQVVAKREVLDEIVKEFVKNFNTI